MNSQSNIVILYKKGKASSNRLVSLTSVAFEFLENVCCTQLKTTLTETTISEQHGFRARRGELHQSCSNYFTQLSIVFLCVFFFYITMLNRFFMFIRSFVCVFVCFVFIPWSYISNFQEESF